ncbi:3'-5' exonuclease [Acinetobacter schindleri]|uniref:3'-5' exonuclease n=1 Tax=Acinetobacter schindleri TaxID=108981 RepID=UPI0032B556FA
MTALIFDTETHKLHGDIIEAAALEVRFYGNESNAILLPNMFDFKKRYKPSEPISPSAMAVHHIVDEDLEKCPSFTKFKMPKDNVQYLIGHNIDYDISAVNRAGTDTNGIKTICTLAMSRYIWPKFESHNLSALTYELSDDRKEARKRLKHSHSALNDCRTTLVLLIHICNEKKIRSMDELYEFSEMARYPTHIFYGKYKGWAIKDMDDKDIHWLMGKTDDEYLRTSLENELLERSNINENEELPF